MASLISYIDKTYRSKTIKEVLSEAETDGASGLSWNEVNALIKKGHNKNSFLLNIFKLVKGVDNMTNSVFNEIDKNKDKILTLQECDLYAQDKCKMSLESILEFKVEDVCNLIDKMS